MVREKGVKQCLSHVSRGYEGCLGGYGCGGGSGGSTLGLSDACQTGAVSFFTKGKLFKQAFPKSWCNLKDNAVSMVVIDLYGSLFLFQLLLHGATVYRQIWKRLPHFILDCSRRERVQRIASCHLKLGIEASGKCVITGLKFSQSRKRLCCMDSLFHPCLNSPTPSVYDQCWIIIPQKKILKNSTAKMSS